MEPGILNATQLKSLAQIDWQILQIFSSLDASSRLNRKRFWRREEEKLRLTDKQIRTDRSKKEVTEWERQTDGKAKRERKTPSNSKFMWLTAYLVNAPGLDEVLFSPLSLRATAPAELLQLLALLPHLQHFEAHLLHSTRWNQWQNMRCSLDLVFIGKLNPQAWEVTDTEHYLPLSMRGQTSFCEAFATLYKSNRCTGNVWPATPAMTLGTPKVIRIWLDCAGVACKCSPALSVSLSDAHTDQLHIHGSCIQPDEESKTMKTCEVACYLMFSH